MQTNPSSQSGRQFVDELERTNEALFRASEMQVEAFFDSKPSKQALIEHFEGRCVNEHINMTEVARRLLEAAPQGDRQTLMKLARQVLDEAVHFNLVAEVIERISGRPVDLADLIAREKAGGGAKGARVLEKIGANDALGLCTYQFIAEGRAHRVWQKMAEIIDDEKIAAAYRRIADDERTHRDFGRAGLEALANSPELQERARKLADEMRRELYEVSCMNCIEVATARKLVDDAYGSKQIH